MAAFTWSLETGIRKAVENVDGVDKSGLDSPCALLHVGKKKNGCDLMVANFSRRFLAKSWPCDGVEENQERICKELLEWPELKPCVESCRLTSPAGHLTFHLNRKHALQNVLSSILDERENPRGRPGILTPLNVLLHDTAMVGIAGGSCEHLGLDQLRTTLLAEHVKQLMTWAGASVQVLRSSNFSSKPNTQCCEHTKIKQDLLSAFSNSQCDGHVDPEKVAVARKRIQDALNHCGYASQTSREEQPCNTGGTLEDCRSVCQSSETNSTSRDEKCRGSVGYSVDVGQYLLANKRLCKVYDKNLQRSTVSITEDILDLIVSLETVAADFPLQEELLALHIMPCKLEFRYQQKGLLWQMLSPSSVAENQQYLSHASIITSSKNEEKQHSQIHVRDLLQIRENQLKEAFTVKYGDTVKGAGWQDSIMAMAIATLKLEILSVSASNTVKVNLSESSHEFRQATFVMYNCARLAKLFQKYEQGISKGMYPSLPNIMDVDFGLLKEEDEWYLFLHYIFKFPSVVQEVIRGAWARPPVTVQLQTHKVTSFLFDLSHEFSSYYGRVHVLLEPREHLFPTMFARLYLMKGIQQVIHNCLELLNIKPVSQL